MWVFLTLFIRFMRSWTDAHGQFKLVSLGNDITNAVALGMVKKAMRFSVLCNKKFDMGQIGSMMQVDCFRVAFLPRMFNMVIFTFWISIVGIVFMGLLVSYAFLSGFAVMILIILFNTWLSRFIVGYQRSMAVCTDQRMKLTT